LRLARFKILSFKLFSPVYDPVKFGLNNKRFSSPHLVPGPYKTGEAIDSPVHTPCSPSSSPRHAQPSVGCNTAAKGSSSVGALPSLPRTVLKFLMWAVFLTWATGIFLLPTKPGQALFRMCIGLVTDFLLGITGTQEFNAFLYPKC
jgi:hypothetical protein